MMKAITLYQPWASAISAGLKHFETRSWKTTYRGVIAIHSAKIGFALEYYEQAKQVKDRVGELPYGAIVAVCSLTDCLRVMAIQYCPSSAHLICDKKPFSPIPVAVDEYPWGDYSNGRYALELTNIRPVKPPIKCRGAQGLWSVPREIERQIGEVSRGM